jgi:hypothetical protein
MNEPQPKYEVRVSVNSFGIIFIDYHKSFKHFVDSLDKYGTIKTYNLTSEFYRSTISVANMYNSKDVYDYIKTNSEKDVIHEPAQKKSYSVKRNKRYSAYIHIEYDTKYESLVVNTFGKFGRLIDLSTNPTSIQSKYIFVNTDMYDVDSVVDFVTNMFEYWEIHKSSFEVINLNADSNNIYDIKIVCSPEYRDIAMRIAERYGRACLKSDNNILLSLWTDHLDVDDVINRITRAIRDLRAIESWYDG